MVGLELRGALGFGAYAASRPFWQHLPKGDGHPVMLVPGFLTNDTAMLPLRYFLDYLGYEAHPWGFGYNLANNDIEMKLIRRVKMIRNYYGEKVSLIGWSLGGVYAREIGRLLPDDVRTVITLSSPFSGLNAPNNAAWIYKLMYNKTIDDIGADLLHRMKQPLTIPHTAIYSKLDGIVSWQCCKHDYEVPIAENIEINSSHWGIVHHPLVMRCIADRLAQQPNNWQPFKRGILEKLWYPY